MKVFVPGDSFNDVKDFAGQYLNNHRKTAKGYSNFNHVYV